MNSWTAFSASPSGPANYEHQRNWHLSWLRISSCCHHDPYNHHRRGQRPLQASRERMLFWRRTQPRVFAEAILQVYTSSVNWVVRFPLLEYWINQSIDENKPLYVLWVMHSYQFFNYLFQNLFFFLSKESFLCLIIMIKRYVETTQPNWH